MNDIQYTTAPGAPSVIEVTAYFHSCSTIRHFHKKTTRETPDGVLVQGAGHDQCCVVEIKGNPPTDFHKNQELEKLVGIAPVKNGPLTSHGGVLVK
jgi:hypothetical protein